jgi:hypothetical protein
MADARRYVAAEYRRIFFDDPTTVMTDEVPAFLKSRERL